MPDIGELGEQLVAEWLQTQGWVILHHRWRCRWGEIDLIARQEDRAIRGERKQGREGDTKLRSNVVERRDKEDKGDKGDKEDKGERVLSTNATSYEWEQSLTNLERNRQLHPSVTPSPSPPFSHSPTVAFVEVKTRSRGNWDADGLLAITPSKRTKLWQTAELFLSEHPDLANLPCRFDVALVNCQRISQRSRRHDTNSSSLLEVPGKAIQVPPVQLGQPVLVAGYQLILQDYIQSAFD